MAELGAKAPAGGSTPTAVAVQMDEITTRLDKYYEGASRYQERRHEEWRETYTLYRDRVITNRLIQRQSVNVPLMKETVKTVLSKTDEFPDIYFESLSGDKQKEIFINEYWKWTLEEDNFEVKDMVDKKQESLYGRSTIKLNLFDGRATFEVLEPYDVVFDRFADPTDIDGTAMYVCHRNIYRSISAIASNSHYKKETVDALRLQYAQAMNLQKAEQTFNEAQAKNERMQDLGLWDTENPAVGETFVELREHYMKRWDEKAGKLRILVRVTAAGNTHTLMEGWLDEILGINFFPFVTWADDIERTDMYPDGIGDIVRTPNKTLNAFFSQMVENRTLRNFGMTFYDSTKGDGKWIPQTYTAEPFGWYAVAGNPNEVTKRVDVQDLSESMDELQFIIGMVERATASTATEKGVKEQGVVTLGQVKILQANANERIVSIAKFYNIARRELGEKWYKLVEANADKLKSVELFKKSYKGKYFSETVKPEDWKDAMGFSCKVVSASERSAKTLDEVQKLTGIASSFSPNNMALKRIVQKKSLDLIPDIRPEEIEEIMNFEKEQAAAMATAVPTDPSATVVSPTPTPAPVIAG